jgi:eukaryotic-like serine/threonine-protein kinase
VIHAGKTLAHNHSEGKHSLSAAVVGHDDLTLDADSPLAIQMRPELSDPSSDRVGMELLEGDSAASQHANSLIQTRLQAASLTLGFGFAIFGIWTAIRELGSRELHLGYGFLGLELITAVVLIGIGVWLAKVNAASASCLRWCELIIFGLPTIAFTVLHYLEIVFMAPIFDVIPLMPMSGWQILIFAYAVFVPRSWLRVLSVVIAISICPLLATVLAMFMHRNVMDLIFHDRSSSVEMILSLVATVFAAVTSVHMINQLRARADEAKELGRYRLKEKIGSGGMGDVYLAEHRLMKRPCAVKVIRPEKAGDPRAIARFEREVRATSRLNHWNSISIYDYGRTADGTFFYVMEYLTGLSVQELVKRRGPMSSARVVYLLKQVCNALSEAHSIQLVHRDIKPANLMVTELGGAFDVIKLLDFGLAKPFADSFKSQDSELTVAGSLTGSPLYMSPEQAMGETEADHRSDIYALGGVAFYMLTGRPPFDSPGTMKVLLSHLNEQPVAPSSIRLQSSGASISPELDAIVLRCLSKLPEERFQSAREMQVALDQLPESNTWTEQLAQQWWTCNCSQYQSENG